jgi:UDP-N-acetylmuramoyl-tripeptide--D-alanyl-D-alanine ligase
MNGVEQPAPPPRPAAADDRGAFWTLDRVAAALQGYAVGNAPAGDAPIARIWTDSRSVQPGDLFVALSGENFDAHEFLAAAVEKGAHALVVCRPEKAMGLQVPTIVVPDCLQALGRLANYRRRAWRKPVIGIVGSNGKTSTKELLKAALGARLDVHATTGNLNNLVGVPLTIFALPEDADVALVEMGTNMPGEVARLRGIVEPDLVVVTSIGEEHLEGLGDLEGVMREEMSAADGIEVVVAPAAQPEVVAEAARRAKRVVSAGLDSSTAEARGPSGRGPQLIADSWSIGPDGLGVVVVEGVEVRPPVRGVHNLRNAMLALAVARECGVSLEDAARGIAAMPLPPMRVHFDQLGSATLINDAYNANPGSARAALELLEHAGRGRQRVAVLGTMRELGAASARMHDEVARAALASGIEVIAGMGEFAEALDRMSADGGSLSSDEVRARVVTAPDVDALWSLLAPRLAPDAVILLKGSRGVRLERLVAPIAEWAGVEHRESNAH